MYAVRAALAIALFCVVATGCSRKPLAATYGSPRAVTPKPTVTIALSSPRARLSSVSSNGREYFAVKWSVNYRVTGQPLADEWYLVTVTTGGPLSTKDVRGSDLKPEGVLDGQALVAKDLPNSVTIEISRGEGTRKGVYGNAPIGGPITVPVEHPDPP